MMFRRIRLRSGEPSHRTAKKSVSVLITLLSLGYIAAAQELPSGFTCSNLNGYTWRNLTSDQKTLYTAGFSDGVNRAVELAWEMLDYWPEKFTVKAAQQALDSFYADPANRRIAVPDALKAIRTTSLGVTLPADFLPKLRLHATMNCSEKEPQ